MKRTIGIAEATSQMQTILAKVTAGTNPTQYASLVDELKTIGFIHVSTGNVEDHDSAIHRFNEVYTENCILIALQDSRRYAQVIKDEKTFEYVCNVNEIPGEQFFIWYENVEDEVKVQESTPA